MTTLPEKVLSAEGLTVEFRTRGGLVRVVDDVSFELRAGETLGVVGESGSGKSVSMLALLGLIRDGNAVVSGRVLFDGQDLLALPAKSMRDYRGDKIAMIFQDPMTSLNPVYRVGWQIAEQIRQHRRIGMRAARRRAVELLEMVGIPSPGARARDYPHQFSGGMRQRVMIAMALSCEPDVLIADEPTTALDVSVQAQILRIIRDLSARTGTSVILITHDLGVLAGIASRVQVMYAGRIVEQAPTAQLFARPQHPYTVGLLGSIPRLDVPRPARLPSIEGLPPLASDLGPGCAFAPRCPDAEAVCLEQRPVLLPSAQEHFDACLLRHASTPDEKRTA
ncbi:MULTISPECIES: ABC transporter ATP-binding protein [Amycolatopsis]|uniref:ABC transporter ATP-binding protein n=1 Tax=Amycolatopsis albidoflavus TaxID=102226 RepID=A0ABW5HSI7_9PSEU